MRNLLALIGAIVVTVSGLGWYLDWFKIRSNPAPAPGYHSVNIDINTGKITEDLHRGSVKVQEVLEKKTETEAKAKPATPTQPPATGKNSAGKAAPAGSKKPYLEEGEEAEEPPTDSRK